MIGAGLGAAISASDADYVRAPQLESIRYSGDMSVGYKVGPKLHVYAIPDDSPASP